MTFPHWPLTELLQGLSLPGPTLLPALPQPHPPPQQMAAEPRPPSRGQQLTRRLVHSLGGSEHLELRG